MRKSEFLALWIIWGLCTPSFAQGPSYLPKSAPPPLRESAKEKPIATLGAPTDTIPQSSPAKLQLLEDDVVPPPKQGPGGIVPAAHPGVSKTGLFDVMFAENHTTVPRPSGQALDCCALLSNPMTENFAIQLGIDFAKEPLDLGINCNFGYRIAFNWGFPLADDQGIGMQIGTALNYARSAQRMLRLMDGPTDRLQSFTTLGLFRRTESGWNYGFVYDFRFDDYYAGVDTSQWRAQLSKNVNDCNEIGVFGSWRQHIDRTDVLGQPLVLRPINQLNMFWKHIWEGDIVTRGWIGLAEEHGRFVLVDRTTNVINYAFAFGFDMHVPLTTSLALFAQAHFITPNDTGTVTGTFGLAWYPGGGARTTTRSRFAPLLPSANNPFFAVDAQLQ